MPRPAARASSTRDRADLPEQFVERQDPAEHLDRARHVVGAALRRFEPHQQPGFDLRPGAVELGLGQALGGRRRAPRARAAPIPPPARRSAAQPIPTSPVSAKAWFQA